MKLSLKIALALLVAVLVAACSSEDMEYFLNSGEGDWTPRSSNYSSTPSSGSSGVARCYQTARNQQTCFR